MDLILILTLLANHFNAFFYYINITNIFSTNSFSGFFYNKMSYDLKVAEYPAYGPFFGYMGVAAAQIFTVFGAAYGTAKSAVGICSMGVMRPELIMKSVIPVIMAGTLFL